MLEIGMKAPEFTLPNQDGDMVSLKDFLGQKVVVYFYPKDNTPGCTQEALGFKDLFDDFLEKNVKILGISKDTVKSHMNFKEKKELPFTLLADTELEAIKAYGVWKEKTLFGKLGFGVVRTTFLIDEEGKIEQILTKPKAKDHPQEVLKLI